jgi:hypothetical protein
VAGLKVGPVRRKLPAVFCAAELDGDQLVLRFRPRGGHPPEIEDRIALGEGGQLATVYGIGRLLRLMRAARKRPPADPYALAHDHPRALELVRRCLGAEVQLHVHKRLRRVLTLWTESGIEQIHGLVDYRESPQGLSILRSGGRSTLQVSRHELIRFEASTEDDYVVIAVENA